MGSYNLQNTPRRQTNRVSAPDPSALPSGILARRGAVIPRMLPLTDRPDPQEYDEELIKEIDNNKLELDEDVEGTLA